MEKEEDQKEKEKESEIIVKEEVTEEKQHGVHLRVLHSQNQKQQMGKRNMKKTLLPSQAVNRNPLREVMNNWRVKRHWTLIFDNSLEKRQIFKTL